MDSYYIKNPLTAQFLVKSIYTIHYFKYGRNFRFPKEKHDFWEMIYVDGGDATIINGEAEIPLCQGQAYFHAPNEEHTVKTDNSFANAAIISFECTSRAMKMFQGKVFEFGDREKALLSEIISEGSKTYQEKLNELHLSKMNKRENAPFASEQIIKNDIENLLIYLLRSTTEESAPQKQQSSKTDELAESIIEILKSKVYSNVTLDEIAKKLYFSKTYVKNVFRKYTGTSVIQYYIDLKIDEAKLLISQNKYSFTEISDKLCFNSVHYFSRLFKQKTDMSPSEYAKSIKVDNLIK